MQKRTPQPPEVHPMEIPAPQSGRSAGAIARDYVTLVKPGIMLALLISCLTAMIVANGGLPAPGLVVATLPGGGFMPGSAPALNNLPGPARAAPIRSTRSRP